MKLKILFFSAALLPMFASAQQKPGAFTGKYPVTQKGAATDTFFGTPVSDPYRWLEQGDDDATRQWIERQNDVTNSYLAQIPFRNDIAKRLKELWNYERFGMPFQEGEYLYFFRNNGLQNQSVLYRMKPGSQPEVFLDPNTFSGDGTVSLSGIEFSKDGSLAAYQTSDGGSDWTSIYVIDAKTKRQVGQPLRNIKFSGIAWRGNQGFYYSTYDRPEGNVLTSKTDQHKLYFHRLNQPQDKDALIFGGGATSRRYVSGSVTFDENFLIISAANATYGNELYLLNLTMERAPIIPIITGFDYESEVVRVKDGKLWILTNKDAPNRRLVTAMADRSQPANWRTIIAEEKFPLSVTAVGDKLFAQYVRDAVSEVRQYDLDGRLEKEVNLPGIGTAGGFSGKPTDTITYYSFTNYVNPPTIYSYDWKTHQSKLWKRARVNFNPDDYVSTQVFYYSKDSTRVPMIITHKKDLKPDGKNPTMLYGYGGFNISLTPGFSVSNLAFMEAGGIYAVANIRGGGEYGDAWHNAGTKLQKQNVFDDFMAAADYLVNNKYTSRDYLAISGGSNGGLLVGACITQRPDLCRVAFPAVGVLDMLRYHKFTAGAGWAYDYGTADDNKEMFQYLYRYSPLHNVRRNTCYPATMIMTGDHDDRVVPAHSFKFAAALQAAQSCSNPTLIRIETRAGHGAGKPTAMLIEEQADKWAFMFWNMGLRYTAPGDKPVPAQLQQPGEREQIRKPDGMRIQRTERRQELRQNEENRRNASER